MTERLFHEIKNCCQRHNKVLYGEFRNGTITFESLADAYDLITGGKTEEKGGPINRTEIASRCAVLCYGRVKKC